MNFKKVFPILLVGALVVAAVAGVFGYRSVQAAAAAVNTLNINLAGLNNGGGMKGGGVSDQNLADALGIPLDKLTAAYTTARDEALKQAVEKGLITQTQADQLKAHSGRFGEFGPYDMTGIDYNAILAKALDVSVDALQAAYFNAYNASIDAQVTSGKLTQEQADLLKGRYTLNASTKFQAAIKAAYEAAVKQAVTDGLITQAQADQILKADSTKGFGGKMEGGRGFDTFDGGSPQGGRGGGRTGNPGRTKPGQATPTPTTPGA